VSVGKKGRSSLSLSGKWKRGSKLQKGSCLSGRKKRVLYDEEKTFRKRLSGGTKIKRGGCGKKTSRKKPWAGKTQALREVRGGGPGRREMNTAARDRPENRRLESGLNSLLHWNSPIGERGRNDSLRQGKGSTLWKRRGKKSSLF